MTVELAMMIPVILLVITGVIYAGFYFHDKNVIYGKVYEFGAIAVQEERRASGLDVNIIEDTFIKDTQDKLLLLSALDCTVKKESNTITIMAEAKYGKMGVEITKEFQYYYVEKNIRLSQPVE